MVGMPWCSIIVPTSSDNPPTFFHRSRCWRNASKTRNMGAAKAQGNVLCFIDDDAFLNFEKLLQTLQAISKDKGYFIWHDPPHLLILNAGIFFEAGGYDERFSPERVYRKLEDVYRGVLRRNRDRGCGSHG